MSRISTYICGAWLRSWSVCSRQSHQAITTVKLCAATQKTEKKPEPKPKPATGRRPEADQLEKWIRCFIASFSKSRKRLLKFAAPSGPSDQIALHGTARDGLANHRARWSWRGHIKWIND